MKKNALAMVTLALLLVALIAGCRRAKPAVVSEVQVTPTASVTTPTGRTVVPVASPTPTSEVVPTITPTPSPEDATPTPTTAVTVVFTPMPVPTVAPTPAPTAAVSGERIHTVQPGENLFRIALHYGMSYTALAAANGIINPDLIYVGQRLTISAKVPAGPTGERIHVVQPGENLFRIALKYGVKVEDITVANGIRNVHLIYSGQRLRIP
ncbi:MAG: LysM peptidoglycan-binding domain-containing protein [Chloroflexi bacterium]|nr:LysM peptidoglycan-binding domain-containing protein [Chloroflexota bacterium]